jgi:acyl-CoA thioesterase
MKEIKQFFTKNDKFAEFVGIELLEVSEGKAKARMEIRDHHLNGVKTVHGAAIFALADLVFAVASNSHGTIAMGINVSISYLKAVTQWVLFAEATQVSINPKLATYAINVTDSDNDLVATFQGMVYRKKQAIGI